MPGATCGYNLAGGLKVGAHRGGHCAGGWHSADTHNGRRAARSCRNCKGGAGGVTLCCPRDVGLELAKPFTVKCGVKALFFDLAKLFKAVGIGGVVGGVLFR